MRWARQSVVDLLLWALARAECASASGAKALNAGRKVDPADLSVLRTSSVLWVDPPPRGPDPLLRTSLAGKVDRPALRVARDWLRARGFVEQVVTKFTTEGGGRQTVDAITRSGAEALHRSLREEERPYDPR